MKTKNGKCDSCPLVKCNHIKNYLIATDLKNVGNPDIFVVTNIEKNGKNLWDFFKKNYPNQKFLVINNFMCENINNIDVKDFCFSNFPALAQNINAKNCFIYDLDINHEKFVNVKNISDVKNKLDGLYKKESKEVSY